MAARVWPPDDCDYNPADECSIRYAEVYEARDGSVNNFKFRAQWFRGDSARNAFLYPRQAPEDWAW